jgi:hypothetical protein
MEEDFEIVGAISNVLSAAALPAKAQSQKNVSPTPVPSLAAKSHPHQHRELLPQFLGHGDNAPAFIAEFNFAKPRGL